MHKKISDFLQHLFSHLKGFVSRLWYPPLVAALAFLDNFVVVIPTDGLLISSSILKPKKWWLFSACIAIGSTLGAAAFAFLVQHYGLPWLLEFFPDLQQSHTWQITESFFQQYGLIVVFIVAASPFFQQPALVLASLSHAPLTTITLVVFAGRMGKFLLLGYLASHAPKILNKLWGIQEEMKEVGLDTRPKD